MKPKLAHRWAMSVPAYAELALQLRTYQWSNRILAERMGLEPDMKVVDLGCGTGATLLAAFRRQPALGHAWAVDGVAEMLSKARDLLQGFPVTFVHEPAETFSRSIPERIIARVLCNSAFFQFADPSAVLAEIRKVLDPGGRFGLTVPGPTGKDNLTEVVAKVAALAATRSGAPSRGRGDSTGRSPLKATGPTCDYRTVRQILQRGGFEVLSSEFISVESTQDEIVRWLLLPVFRPPEWGSLTDEEAARAMQAILERNSAMPRTCWNVVTAGLG